MYDKLRDYDKTDRIKEIIWSIILTILFFGYWVILLMAITFALNSIIYLTFKEILIISVLLTAGMQIFRIIRGILKHMG